MARPFQSTLKRKAFAVLSHTRLLPPAILIAATLPLGPAYAQAEVTSAGKGWTVLTSIERRRIVSADDAFGVASQRGKASIHWSPSRRRFYFITKRGDLATDEKVAQVSIFEAAAVIKWLRSGARGKPPTLAVFERRSRASSEYFPAMSDVVWGADEDRLLFLSDDSAGRYQVFEYAFQPGQIQQLTNASENVRWFVAGADAIAYGTFEPWHFPKPSYPAQRAARIRVPGVFEGELGTPFLSDGMTFIMGKTRVFAQGLGSAPREIENTFGASLNGAGAFWIAPHGTSAIAVAEDRFVRLELDTGRSTNIGAVCAGGPGERAPMPSAIWAPDGARAALTGFSVPNSGGCGVAIIQDDVLPPTVITPASGTGEPSIVRWADAQKILLTTEHRTTAFAAPSFAQAPAASAQQAKPDLGVSVVQAANRPPRILASLGNARADLIAPDPVLDNVWLAQQQPFEWTEPGGTRVTGGLYLPRNYRPGYPVPLVVQAYRYAPDVFLPDGENTTVDEAQLLVANGFAVLKYDIRSDGNSEPWGQLPAGQNEGQAARERFDAAVGALIDRGIVDPTRIGLTGFSRAGFQAYYLVTHPGKVKIGAAISADGATFSFSDYVDSAAKSALSIQHDSVFGGSFWNDPEAWLKNNPTFNVHRSSTPYLVTMNGGDALRSGSNEDFFRANEVERLGAFTANRRPIDYVVFPEGSHNLQRPKERQAMLSLTLDWMRFWLMGEEDASELKAGQYNLWRTLREEWIRQQAWEAMGHPIGSTPAIDFKTAQ